VRLPIPPPPQGRYFFAGTGVTGTRCPGAVCVGIFSGTVFPFGSVIVGPFTGAGAPLAGAVLLLLPDVVSRTVLAPVDPRVAKIESDSDVTMNMIADAVVAFESKVAEPRGPKAVCEPIPPNAPAKSAAFPLCSSTTIIRKMQTITCTIVNSINISPFSI
jgi:hypothetical protein